MGGPNLFLWKLSNWVTRRQIFFLKSGKAPFQPAKFVGHENVTNKILAT